MKKETQNTNYVFSEEDFDRAVEELRTDKKYLDWEAFERWVALQSNDFKLLLENEMKKHIQNYGKEDNNKDK